MECIHEYEALAVSLVQAIHTGDTLSLRQLLVDHPGLARLRIVQSDNSSQGSGISRTLLHVATDWPGHFPSGSATVNLLIQFGAEVNAPFAGPHTETPLHWAASCNDIDVLDALLDAGADLESPGAVIAGGTPLDDAIAFGQWEAARRLVERGARMALWHAAALGQLDVVEAHFAGNWLEERYPWGASSNYPPDKVTVAFWCACHGGQKETAAHLLQQGAELNWRAVWDGLTPLDAAKRSGATDTVSWLVSQGGQSAQD
ncbi:ankyrin repeat domain-containing protein [Paenibacillus sp. 1P07SE]|uniref:ankyrin repeat domain-containing protein n=1 Tax=Paenibacillus sp. 1P07SE TaxID=3132209 RepID=UPI0039A54686